MAVSPANGQVSSSPSLIADNTSASQAAPHVSLAIVEILKLVDAKVDPAVIKSFIESSPIAYQPTANDLIVLKQNGASPEVLQALLDHGTILRAQAAQAAAAAAAGNYAVNPATQTAPPSTSTADYTHSSQAGQTGENAYTYGNPGYNYVVYPTTYYSYTSPWWPWYVGWYWPVWYGGSCYGYGGHYHPYSCYYGHYPYSYSSGYYHVSHANQWNHGSHPASASVGVRSAGFAAGSMSAYNGMRSRGFAGNSVGAVHPMSVSRGSVVSPSRAAGVSSGGMHSGNGFRR